MSQERVLAAIMFTDIVGYTALMGEDEEKAFELLKKNRQVQRPIIEKYNGRWLKEIGDGVLASFSTVSDAVYCAKTIQEACLKEDDLKLRIGIHQGEVVFEGEDVFGDGVNIASRLQALAPAGGIWVSESVHKNVLNKKGVETRFVREEHLKNVKESVRIYEVEGSLEEREYAEISSPPPTLKETGQNSFLVELGRRNVFRAGIAYVVVAWLVLQIAEIIDRKMMLPEWSFSTLLIILAVGFPLALYLAWSFERSPQGFVRIGSPESRQNPFNPIQKKPLTSNLIIVVMGIVNRGHVSVPQGINNQRGDSTINHR